jgi:hypothetical protein
MDPADPAFPAWLAEQQKKQFAYERRRRAWAEAVGRPYLPLEERDPRPPPGAVDAGESE